MYSCMFLSIVDVSLGRSAYFIFFLSEQPFLGLVGEAAPPPVCFLPILARSASTHYCFFNKVYLKTLDIFLTWILIRVWYGKFLEGSSPLLSVLLRINVSNVFKGGSKVVSNYFQLFLCDLDCLYHPIYWGISYLVASYLAIWLLVWWRLFLVDISCTSVPYDDRGSKILGGTAPLRIRGSSNEEGLNKILDRPKSSQFYWGLS